jgi:hypothetical protein
MAPSHPHPMPVIYACKCLNELVQVKLYLEMDYRRFDSSRTGLEIIESILSLHLFAFLYKQNERVRNCVTNNNTVNAITKQRNDKALTCSSPLRDLVRF